jgi:hypothetical protein
MSATDIDGVFVHRKPKRRVSIRRHGEDFVVVSLTEGIVIFRNREPGSLRKLCRQLGWEIAVDSCPSGDVAAAADAFTRRSARSSAPSG